MILWYLYSYMTLDDEKMPYLKKNVFEKKRLKLGISTNFILPKTSFYYTDKWQQKKVMYKICLTSKIKQLCYNETFKALCLLNFSVLRNFIQKLFVERLILTKTIIYEICLTSKLKALRNVEISEALQVFSFLDKINLLKNLFCYAGQLLQKWLFTKFA